MTAGFEFWDRVAGFETMVAITFAVAADNHGFEARFEG
jgi:hypothetical protein